MTSGRALLLLAAALAVSAEDNVRLRVLVERAKEAEQQERLEDAAVIYGEILKLRPHWPSAELNLGLVYHSLKRYPQSIAQLTDALRHNPGLESAYLFRGADYYLTGDSHHAIADLRRYLQHDPESAEALTYLARAYYDSDDFLDAARTLLVQVRLSPGENLLFQLSDSYLQLAAFSMRRLSTHPSGKYYFLVLSAEELIGDQQRQIADEQLRNAVRMNPSAPEAHAAERRRASGAKERCEVGGHALLSDASCRAERGDLEGATTALASVRDATPEDARVIYWTFRLAKTLAQHAMARLAASAPASPYVPLLRAQMAETNGDADAAERDYRLALSSPDVGLEGYIRFGKFQCKRGRFREGLDLYESALRMDPANARVQALIGEVRATQGEPEKALPYLQQALASAPHDTQSRIYLAQSLMRLDRIAEAVAVLEAAPADPDGRIHYLLGSAYQKTGDREKARRAMEVFRQRKARLER